MSNRFLPVVYIVVAVAIFFLYTDPMYSGSISETRQSIASVDKAIDAADKFQQDKAALENQKNQIPQEDLDRIKKLLPDTVDNVKAILELDAMATANGAQIADIDITSNDAAQGDPNALVQSQDKKGVLEIKLSTVATYAGFKAFLEAIEKDLRAMDVVSISASDSENGVYKYDVGINVYWLR